MNKNDFLAGMPYKTRTCSKYRFEPAKNPTKGFCIGIILDATNSHVCNVKHIKGNKIYCATLICNQLVDFKLNIEEFIKIENDDK